MSKASTSEVNRANAFFEPSGLYSCEHDSSLHNGFAGRALPDHCVDLYGVHVVQLLQSGLDLPLVRLHVHDENQSVVFFNPLHCALGVERVNDHFVVIETGLMWDGLAWVFR